jgi:hypothetical protein
MTQSPLPGAYMRDVAGLRAPGEVTGGEYLYLGIAGRYLHGVGLGR